MTASPNPSEKLHDRILRLEELVSHQQHLLEQLNEVATSLQTQLFRQQQEHKAELEKLRSQMSDSADGDLPHEKPPHY